MLDLRLFGFVCFSSSWCLGRTAVCDCGTPWTFLLPIFYSLLLCGSFYVVLSCLNLFLCFCSVLLALWLPRLGKRKLVLMLFVRLFDLRLFGCVCFLFLLVSGKGYGLWLCHSLDFSLNFFFYLLLVKVPTPLWNRQEYNTSIKCLRCTYILIDTQLRISVYWRRLFGTMIKI